MSLIKLQDASDIRNECDTAIATADTKQPQVATESTFNQVRARDERIEKLEEDLSAKNPQLRMALAELVESEETAAEALTQRDVLKSRHSIIMSSSSTAAQELDRAAASFHQWLHRDVAHAIQHTIAGDKTASFSQRAGALFIYVTTLAPRGLSSQHAQVVLDFVFRPLAKYATEKVSITALLSAIRTLLGGDHRNGHIFATAPALNDIYFPVAQTINSAECCDLLLEILFTLSTVPQSHATFATAELRDRIVIPLAQYATTDSAANNLVTVVNNFASTPERRALFGTKTVRDCVFVRVAKFVETPASASRFFFVLSVILQDGTTGSYGSGPRVAVYRTHAMRDAVFVPLARFVTDPHTTKNYIIALAELIGEGEFYDRKAAALFGTKAVRDRVLVPISKSVTTDELVTQFFGVLFWIRRSCPQRLFATKAFCDSVIIPLACFCTSPRATSELIGFVANLVQGSPSEAHIHMNTVAMRDGFFFPLARQVVLHQLEQEAVQLIIITCLTFEVAPAEVRVFASASVCNVIIPLARLVPDEMLTWVFRAIAAVVTCANDSEQGEWAAIFATVETRDQIFCRGAPCVSARDNKSARALLRALAFVLAGEVRCDSPATAMFATSAVRDEVLLPIFLEHGTGTIDCFAGILRDFDDTPLRMELADDEEESLSERQHTMENQSADAPGKEGALRTAPCFKDSVLMLLAERATSDDHVCCLVRLLEKCAERY